MDGKFLYIVLCNQNPGEMAMTGVFDSLEALSAYLRSDDMYQLMCSLDFPNVWKIPMNTGFASGIVDPTVPLTQEEVG